MSKENSLLLDLLRFLAALAVLVSHANDLLDVSFLSPFASFGHDSVLFFFILSGFVIAYVSKEKEHSIKDYTIARAARMYSVVIPSLILVLILYILGALYFPNNYINIEVSYWTSMYLKSIFFLNQTSLAHASIPTNGPFWSVSYEVWYYIIFGSFFYLKGIKKWLITSFIMGIAGIKILTLLPIWISGYLLYQLSIKIKDQKLIGIILVIFSLATYSIIRVTNFDDMLFSYSANLFFQNEANANNILGYSKRFMPDFLICALFLSLLTGLFMLSKEYGAILIPYEKIIRTMASYSFSIYLLHYPLFTFFNNMTHNGIIVIISSLLLIILIGKFTENKKHYFKSVITRLTKRTSL